MSKRPQGYYACVTLSSRIPGAVMGDDRAKAYMLNRIMQCAPAFNIDVVAYYIAPDTLSLLLGSREGIGAALIDYAECLNGEFSEYYNQTFERVGMVFQSAYNVMRLKSAGKIADCVLSLHYACNYAGQDMASYAYSSYPAYLNASPILTDAYAYAVGKPFDMQAFYDSHAKFTPKKDYTSAVRERLGDVLSENIARYPAYASLNKESLSGIIVNTVRRTEVPFDKVYKKFRLPEGEKNEVLLYCLLNLTLDEKFPFYDAAELLGIEGFTDELILDTIAKVREKTGYSEEYAKYFMGL